jgi:putative hydrolase of the HAD superfamily
VYTSEIPHVKPHPEAFRAALAAVGATEPGACVYVGDRPFEDIHGARNAGMRAILVPNSEIPVAERVDVEVAPDGVAHRLLDVLDLVDGWSTPA